MAETSDQGMPADVLKAEHRIILRVTAVLERLINKSESSGQFDADAMGTCVQFFQLFADAFHHAKEEDLLFPTLEKCGIPRDQGPIGVMLEEHKMARALTQAMADGLKQHAAGDSEGANVVCRAGKQYIELLGQHIYKEDNILYPMGDRVMSDQDQATLCDQFCEAGCRSFGGKNAEELTRMADELEAAHSGS